MPCIKKLKVTATKKQKKVDRYAGKKVLKIEKKIKFIANAIEPINKNKKCMRVNNNLPILICISFRVVK
jgi:hypothetical protein